MQAARRQIPKKGLSPELRIKAMTAFSSARTESHAIDERVSAWVDEARCLKGIKKEDMPFPLRAECFAISLKRLANTSR